jgi:hypothetical protein
MSNLLSKINSDVVNPFGTKNNSDSTKIINNDAIMSPNIVLETETASKLLSGSPINLDKYNMKDDKIFGEYIDDTKVDNSNNNTYTPTNDDEFIELCKKYLSDKPDYLGIIIRLTDELSKMKSKKGDE